MTSPASPPAKSAHLHDVVSENKGVKQEATTDAGKHEALLTWASGRVILNSGTIRFEALQHLILPIFEELADRYDKAIPEVRHPMTQ